MGCEVLGVVANEAPQSRETLPKATDRVWVRVIFLYIGAIFVLTLNLSANDPVLGVSVTRGGPVIISPFVLMAQRAGIPGLDHAINSLGLVATISVANADLYVAVWYTPVSSDGRLVRCTPCLRKDTRRDYCYAKIIIMCRSWPC
jgi:yeast amino acid transporter